MGRADTSAPVDAVHPVGSVTKDWWVPTTYGEHCIHLPVPRDRADDTCFADQLAV